MSADSITSKVPTELIARDIGFPLNTRVLIMGVLNITPDSFSDGGHYLDPVKAFDHVQQMGSEGADIVDIGGESSRPGALSIDAEEEMRRLKPVLKLLGRQNSIPISVDTRKASVAQMALDFGAIMVNDISALRDDPKMGPVVAKAKAGLILMHMQGNPQIMQQAPAYHDVIEEIKQFLAARFSEACKMGIDPRNILLDPGIGFGKNVSHNLTILNRLHQFLELGRPLMVGVSRKSFIGKILERPVGDRCMGTAAAVAVAVLRGAQVIRVHEVGAMKEVAKLARALKEA